MSLLVTPATYTLVAGLTPYRMRELILTGRVRTFICGGRRLVAWTPRGPFGSSPKPARGFEIGDMSMKRERPEGSRVPPGLDRRFRLVVTESTPGGFDAPGPQQDGVRPHV